MKHLPISLVALLCSLLLQTPISAEEKGSIPYLTAEEALAVIKADEYALIASQLHADGDLDGAEKYYMKSLRIFPHHPKTEERRNAYRKELARILDQQQEKPRSEPEREYEPNSSDIEDKHPFGYKPGPPTESKDIILPKVEFSNISLTEALVNLEALSQKFDHYPLIVDRGVKIYFDAPSPVANTAITLHLTNVPLSEAILRTAELGSCRAFHVYFGRAAMVSCVDLLAPLNVEGKISVSPAAVMWHDAYEKLQMAESAAKERNKPKARYYYREALDIYTTISVQHPEFHPEMVGARMKDLAEILERK